ncbi:MAG TPA: 2-oxo acid dehydrogenase subunit E2 [Thiobacillaceae bacterium]|nr:2-oxo acid dehydrogenase subunit E2 [Thiobacillaceae bacterium]
MNDDKESTNRFFRVFCALPEREIEADVSVSFSSTLDLSAIEAARAAAAHAGTRKPSYTAFVIRAVGRALQEHPYANRRVFRSPWRLGGPWLHSFDQADIAVAAERDVPGREYVAFVDVLREADRRSLDEIHTWLAALARSDEENNAQWREFSALIRRFPWRLSALILRLPAWIPSWWTRYRGAAVLVSSPAKYGVGSVTASWAWPIGISFGYVGPRPVVRDGEVVVRPCFEFLMNFDRRVMAGAAAARFFKRICELIEAGDEAGVHHAREGDAGRADAVDTVRAGETL